MAHRDLKGLKPVSQPLGAYQQTQDPPPWAFDPALTLKLVEEMESSGEEVQAVFDQTQGRSNLKTMATDHLQGPVLALESWAQDEVTYHGLLDVKFFPRDPNTPSHDMRKVANEILKALSSTSEDVSDQDL